MRTVLDYVLERPVRVGPDTVVQRARRLPGHEVVAIKLVAPGLTQGRRSVVDGRLRLEAAALSAVRHPALVPLIEVLEIPAEQGRLRRYGTDPGPRTEAGLVLAWARLGSLADALHHGPLEPAAALVMARQVAGALAALHAAGVVHGDVAPGNVLWADDRTWWLADLGDSRRSGAGPDHGGRPRGTDGFVAPEVRAGGPAGPAADVFGLGCLLAAALGRSPDTEALDAVDGLVRRTTSADPEARPTATIVEHELLQATPGGDPRPPPPPERDIVESRSSDVGPVTRDFALPAAIAAPAPTPTHAAFSAPPHRRRPRAVSIAAVAAVVTVMVGALTLAAAWPRSAANPPAPSPSTAIAAAGVDDLEPERDPCVASSTEAPPGAVLVPGDPDGAGCTVAVLWWPDRAEAERPDPSGARHLYSLGRPGDQLLLGDWDDDGRDTPALYDPTTGTLSRFDGWAEPDQPLPGSVVTADAPTGGIAHVHRRAGPDQVDVDPATP